MYTDNINVDDFIVPHEREKIKHIGGIILQEVKVAMIGFGGIAKSHKKGYEILTAQGAAVRLVAICDVNPDAFTAVSQINLGSEKRADLSGIATYCDLDAMLENEEFDMADICVPSFLHAEIAVKMLRAGKHVLSEKPMALRSADCERMLSVAKESGKRLMIGQCLRFEPSYLFLKRAIDSGEFGSLCHLSMTRLSPYPRWGFEGWYHNQERSGGAIMDLHIHDIDMARFLLGEPKAVSTVAHDGITRWQYCNTRLYYPGLVVNATGSWDEAATVPFEAGFRARFEKASVVLSGANVTVYPDEGTVYHAVLPEVEAGRGNRMAEEIRHLVGLILAPEKENLQNPPESAAKTVALIETLRESADANGKILSI